MKFVGKYSFHVEPYKAEICLKNTMSLWLVPAMPAVKLQVPLRRWARLSSGDNEYEHHRSNVMQSSNGRCRERSNCAGNRRSWGTTQESSLINQ